MSSRRRWDRETSSQGEQPSVREEGSGVLPGVGRAFQALPTAAEEVTGGRVSNPGSTGAVRAGDSVEYASVASSVARRESVLQPHVEQVPETPLLDSNTMRRLQQLHSSAPQLYGHSPETIPPRPPSTTSSDIQMEVRRQLNEVMNLHEEESRRLRAQVEALVAENYELRMNSLNDVQGRQATSRPWLVTQGGFPGLGWLGRGLGSIIGGSPPPPPQPMDFKGSNPSSAQPWIGRCFTGAGINAHSTTTAASSALRRAEGPWTNVECNDIAGWSTEGCTP